MIVWDALALKGSCHIWIDGEGECKAEGATKYILWGDEEAPKEPEHAAIYVLASDCPGIDAKAVTGTMWQYDDKSKAWSEYTGELLPSER